MLGHPFRERRGGERVIGQIRDLFLVLAKVIFLVKGQAHAASVFQPHQPQVDRLPAAGLRKAKYASQSRVGIVGHRDRHPTQCVVDNGTGFAMNSETGQQGHHRIGPVGLTDTDPDHRARGGKSHLRCPADLGLVDSRRQERTLVAQFHVPIHFLVESLTLQHQRVADLVGRGHVDAANDQQRGKQHNQDLARRAGRLTRGEAALERRDLGVRIDRFPSRGVLGTVIRRLLALITHRLGPRIVS